MSPERTVIVSVEPSTWPLTLMASANVGDAHARLETDQPPQRIDDHLLLFVDVEPAEIAAAPA